jgi:hypothetical protein
MPSSDKDLPRQCTITVHRLHRHQRKNKLSYISSSVVAASITPGMSVAEALAAVDATVGVTGTRPDLASLQATDGKQKEFVQRMLLRPPLVADDSCDGPAGVASAPGDDEESEVETEDEAAESAVAMIVPIRQIVESALNWLDKVRSACYLVLFERCARNTNHGATCHSAPPFERQS